jgi:hypothetical protein
MDCHADACVQPDDLLHRVADNNEKHAESKTPIDVQKAIKQLQEGPR